MNNFQFLDAYFVAADLKKANKMKMIQLQNLINKKKISVSH